MHWIYHCSRVKYEFIYKDPLLVVKTCFTVVLEEESFDAKLRRIVTHV